MKINYSETFLESVKRLAKMHLERCKTNPVLMAEHKRTVKQRECSKTHEKWLEDRDVHGHLGYYCARCGAWEMYYSWGNYTKESFMTCDELLAERK